MQWSSQSPTWLKCWGRTLKRAVHASMPANLNELTQDFSSMMWETDKDTQELITPKLFLLQVVLQAIETWGVLHFFSQRWENPVKALFHGCRCAIFQKCRCHAVTCTTAEVAHGRQWSSSSSISDFRSLHALWFFFSVPLPFAPLKSLHIRREFLFLSCNFCFLHLNHNLPTTPVPQLCDSFHIQKHDPENHF